MVRIAETELQMNMTNDITRKHQAVPFIYVGTNGSDLKGDGLPGNPYATIQKAVDEATNGQSIFVLGGTYSGVGNHDWDLKGKLVSITSVLGPVSTIIDCGRGRIFSATRGEPIGTMVSGFTFRNAYCSWSGDWFVDSLVRIRNSSIIIRNCIFTANETSVGYVTSTTSIVGTASNDSIPHSIHIENCLFCDNVIGGGAWTKWGGGGASVITTTDHGWLSPNSTVHIDRCTIAGNKIYSSVAGWGSYGSGVLRAISANSQDHIINSIVYSNSPPSVPEGLAGNGPAHVWGGALSYSDIEGGWRDGKEGPGLITRDPQFVAPLSGNYELKKSSPCKGSGAPSSANDPDGSCTDMGYSSSHFEQEAVQWQ